MKLNTTESELPVQEPSLLSLFLQQVLIIQQRGVNWIILRATRIKSYFQNDFNKKTAKSLTKTAEGDLRYENITHLSSSLVEKQKKKM